MSSELDAQSKKIATRKNRGDFFFELRTQNTEHRTQTNDTDLELNSGQCLLSVVRCL